MLRLFVRAPLAAGDAVPLAGDDLHHLRVRRLHPGDPLRLVDPSGAEHDAIVERVGTRDALARVGARVAPVRESPLDLVLAAALLRGPRMDLVVEKATELGVRRIVAVEAARGVARGGHVERWERIAVAAAKQSGRTRVPAVDAPRPLAAVVAEPWPGLRLMPWEREETRRLAHLEPHATAVVALVGPEGGFTDAEVAAARGAGFVTVTLGPRVLRGETAAIVVTAACQARWGDG